MSFGPINSLVTQLEAFGGPKVPILGQKVPFLDGKSTNFGVVHPY